MSRVKVVNSTHFHFYFHFQFLLNLFFICLFLELMVRDKVMRSHGHIPVTSEDIVIGHEIQRKMMLYNIGNTC